MNATETVGRAAASAFATSIPPQAAPDVIAAEYAAFRGALSAGDTQQAFDRFVIELAPAAATSLGLPAKLQAEITEQTRLKLHSTIQTVNFVNRGTSMSSNWGLSDEAAARIFGAGVARTMKEGGYRTEGPCNLTMTAEGRGVCEFQVVRPDPNHRGLGLKMDQLAEARVTFNIDGSIHAVMNGEALRKARLKEDFEGLVRSLTTEGITRTNVFGGIFGEVMAKQFSAGLVLSEIAMTEVGGLTARAEIRADASNPATKIIAAKVELSAGGAILTKEILA